MEINATIIDVAIAGVVLISAILAYSRGFVREAFTLGVWVVSSAISAVLRSPALRSIDKGLGFLFGALRGLLLLALLWLLIEYIQPSLLASEAVVTSRGAGLVRETSTAIFEAMPWNFFEQLIADFFSDAPKPAPGFENLPTSNPPANDTL